MKLFDYKNNKCDYKFFQWKPGTLKKFVKENTSTILDKKYWDDVAIDILIWNETDMRVNLKRMYSVWRTCHNTWWDANAGFISFKENVNNLRPDRQHKINKFKDRFIQIENPIIYIVIFTYKTNIMVIDGNHKLFALLSNEMLRKRCKVIILNINIANNLEDLISPDFYVFKRFVNYS